MILITGCAGFIGFHLTKTLLDANKKVLGIDNLYNNYDIALKNKRLDLLKSDNFTFLKIDIRNLQDIDKLFSIYQIELVIHLAAIPGVRQSIEAPYDYLDVNTKGTLNILEIMKKYCIKKIVMGSTSSLYAGQNLPFQESNEMLPISPYAVTKGAAELMAYAYSYLNNLDVTILRFFTVYGRLGRPDMSYYRFIDAIKNDKEIDVYGNGEQYRDFTYIDDVVDAIIKSFGCEGFNLINIGTGKTITINELISKIEIILDKKAEINRLGFNKADMEMTKADNSKALNVLKWVPKVDIDEGLKKTIGV